MQLAVLAECDMKCSHFSSRPDIFDDAMTTHTNDNRYQQHNSYQAEERSDVTTCPQMIIVTMRAPSLCFGLDTSAAFASFIHYHHHDAHCTS